jgi:protein phosphatase
VSSAALALPEQALLVLIGDEPARAAFAATHLAPGELAAPGAVEERLRAGLFTAVDATNHEREERAAWVRLARAYYMPAYAVVLTCEMAHARLPSEGFRDCLDLSEAERARATTILRVPLACNQLAHLSGPFDVIGDVHGCRPELDALLARLGWALGADGRYDHPAGRRLVFVGDPVDRGPDVPGVLELVLELAERGRAAWVPGNHDDKLHRWLLGRAVQTTHGLAVSIAQLEALAPELRSDLVRRFQRAYAALPTHLVLDGGALVVAHAGIKAKMIGRHSPSIAAFTRYGEVTGRQDAEGHNTVRRLRRFSQIGWVAINLRESA